MKLLWGLLQDNLSKDKALEQKSLEITDDNWKERKEWKSQILKRVLPLIYLTK